MRKALRLALELVLGLALAATAPVAGADDQETKRQTWVARYETLVSQEKELREDLEEARVEYSRGRRGNRLRGDRRVEVVEAVERLEKELTQAQRELADFPEKARAAGALPGWFRDR